MATFVRGIGPVRGGTTSHVFSRHAWSVDSGSYGFVAWWRGDIQVARPKAFDVVTGVKP